MVFDGNRGAPRATRRMERSSQVRERAEHDPGALGGVAPGTAAEVII